MDYEKKYKNALEWARKIVKGEKEFSCNEVEKEIFPELAELEDERIRKVLIDYFNRYKEQEECGIKTFFGIPTDNILAWLEKQKDTNALIQEASEKAYTEGMRVERKHWLEKQGDNNNQNWKPSKEQINALEHYVRSIGESGYGSPYDNNTKLVYSVLNDLKQILANSEKTCKSEQGLSDNVESMFNIGDWITDEESKEVFYISKKLANLYEIVDFKGNDYRVPPSVLYREFSLWTIHDTKDGDVLVDVYGNIGIFQKNDDFDWSSYCSLGSNGGFRCFAIEHELDRSHPATKEQRDLLFQKMREAGYTFDFENKELKKLTQSVTKTSDKE